MAERISIRQDTFINLLLAGYSTLEAYLQAGYKSSSTSVARNTAWRMLRKPHVANELEARKADLAIRRRITTDEIIHGVHQIATDSATRPTDRLRAWELLGRLTGALGDASRGQDIRALAYHVQQYRPQAIDLKPLQQALSDGVNNGVNTIDDSK